MEMLQYPSTYGNAASFKGYVIPRRGFPASTYVADLDINTRFRNKNHMNLSESAGFFGESSSKIINTTILSSDRNPIAVGDQPTTLEELWWIH
jgi:hypothetical protein